MPLQQNQYEYAKTCPQVGVRTYKYIAQFAHTTRVYMDIDFILYGPAPNDTLWLNVTFSR
jgi:hypothetical protein